MSHPQGDPEEPYGAPQPPPFGAPQQYQPYGAPPPPAPYGAPQVPGHYGYPVPPAGPPAPSGMYVAAAVINWVVLGVVTVATCGLGIVAAAWYVPMTIYIHKGAKDPFKHTGLAVCTLLFCNLISGILMLVDEGNRAPRPGA